MKHDNAKTTFLVPEVNLFNFPLYYVLSFIYRIEAYEIQPLFMRCKRIRLLDLLDCINWEDSIITESRAVDLCENILQAMPKTGWEAVIRGQRLDLSLKARQDLQKEAHKFLLMGEMARLCRDKKAYVVDSLKIRFLSALAGKKTPPFSHPRAGRLSAVNIILDRLFLKAVGIARLGKTIHQFIYGISRNRRLRGKINYIYDGVSPRELSVSKDKITFSWIADDGAISKKDILFILPKADFQMKKYLGRRTDDTQLLACSSFSILTFASYGKLFSCMGEIIKACGRILLPVLSLQRLMSADYLVSILAWIPFIESVSPKVYMTTSSNLGIESPALLYFNKAGIKTVAWFYGTTHCRFLTRPPADTFRFRHIAYCNIISRTVVAWNAHVKEFIESHPQEGLLEVKVIGPLMCGDETVFEQDRLKLCKKLGLSRNGGSKYIAIFDSPHASRTKNFAIPPEVSSEDYNYMFIRDAYRLLSDLPETALIYKPKRSLTSGKFNYSKALRQLLGEMANDPRVLILDYNINPWIPFALADVCISLPFESPSIIALHYEKLGLFHDPEGVALYHRCGIIPEFISHDYDQLKMGVKNFLFGDCDISALARIRPFQGACPKENSSAKFREYLAFLTKNTITG